MRIDAISSCYLVSVFNKAVRYMKAGKVCCTGN